MFRPIADDSPSTISTQQISIRTSLSRWTILSLALWSAGRRSGRIIKGNDLRLGIPLKDVVGIHAPVRKVRRMLGSDQFQNG